MQFKLCRTKSRINPINGKVFITVLWWNELFPKLFTKWLVLDMAEKGTEI